MEEMLIVIKENDRKYMLRLKNVLEFIGNMYLTCPLEPPILTHTAIAATIRNLEKKKKTLYMKRHFSAINIVDKFVDKIIGRTRGKFIHVGDEKFYGNCQSWKNLRC